MHTNRRRFLIEWGDCEPAGIVFFPRFFAYFDACTAALFASAGVDVYALQKRRVIAGIPMVDLRARFVLPVQFGDEVTVESAVPEVRRSSFDVRHRLHKADSLAVEALETRVWTEPQRDDPGRLKAVPIPDDVRRRLAGQ